LRRGARAASGYRGCASGRAGPGRQMTDEEIVTRMETGIPPSSPEETERRREYEGVIRRIREQPDCPAPPGWEDRAVARWAAQRRRRRVMRWTAAVALVAATAAGIVALL